MNIEKLHEYFIDDYDVSYNIKSVFKDQTSNINKIIKIRKLNIYDKQYSGVSVKIQQRENFLVNSRNSMHHYDFYIIHNKQFINHSFVLMTDIDYKWEVLKRKDIKEQYIAGIRCSTLEEVKNFILKSVDEQNHWWYLQREEEKEEVPF